jgi:hypothetical protein
MRLHHTCEEIQQFIYKNALHSNDEGGKLYPWFLSIQIVNSPSLLVVVTSSVQALCSSVHVVMSVVCLW